MKATEQIIILLDGMFYAFYSTLKTFQPIWVFLILLLLIKDTISEPALKLVIILVVFALVSIMIRTLISLFNKENLIEDEDES